MGRSQIDFEKTLTIIIGENEAFLHAVVAHWHKHAFRASCLA